MSCNITLLINILSYPEVLPQARMVKHQQEELCPWEQLWTQDPEQTSRTHPAWMSEFAWNVANEAHFHHEVDDHVRGGSRGS